MSQQKEAMQQAPLDTELLTHKELESIISASKNVEEGNVLTYSFAREIEAAVHAKQGRKT